VRLLPLLAALLFAPLAAVQAADAPESKPNIVFILVDDMPYAGSGVTGNPVLPTPAMDRIAKEGMVFTRAYTEPVCGPSRATIMTGQFAGRNGFTDNAPGSHPKALMRENLLPAPPAGQNDEGKADGENSNGRLPIPVKPGGYSLVQALKSGGYRTAISGKWHIPQHLLGAREAREYGFDFCAVKVDKKNPYRDTQHLTDEAIRFMQENKDKPFFLYLPYVAVHGGHVVPPEDKARWKEKLNDKDPGIDPDMLASLEFVDLSVGRVLAELDELGLTDNTMVVLASDNGGIGKLTYSPANHPLRWGKGTLYEGGVRVPLFIRWPGHITPGAHSDTPVHFSDFLPTFCAAAGVTVDPGHPVDGTSLLPLFSGGKIPERTFFINYPHYLSQFGTTPVRAVVQDRYKLVWNPYDHIEVDGNRLSDRSIRYIPQPRIELFDLQADPGERENLAGKLPEKVAELRQLFEKWMSEVGAKELEPNPDYDPADPLFNARNAALKKEKSTAD